MTVLLSLLGWLTGSKIGRYVALGAIAAAALGFLYLRIKASGAEAERLKMLQQSLENLRTRIKVDDEITQLSPDARRERLGRWVRDD